MQNDSKEAMMIDQNLIDSLINDKLFYDSKQLLEIKNDNFTLKNKRAGIFGDSIKDENLFSRKNIKIEGKYEQLLRLLKSIYIYIYIYLYNFIIYMIYLFIFS